MYLESGEFQELHTINSLPMYRFCQMVSYLLTLWNRHARPFMTLFFFFSSKKSQKCSRSVLFKIRKPEKLGKLMLSRLFSMKQKKAEKQKSERERLQQNTFWKVAITLSQNRRSDDPPKAMDPDLSITHTRVMYLFYKNVTAARRWPATTICCCRKFERFISHEIGVENIKKSRKWR